MAKYRVYGVISASCIIGEYEAESKEEAIKLAEADPNADFYPSICHQCSNDVELGDIYETEAEEIN